MGCAGRKEEEDARAAQEFYRDYNVEYIAAKILNPAWEMAHGDGVELVCDDECHSGKGGACHRHTLEEAVFLSISPIV